MTVMNASICLLIVHIYMFGIVNLYMLPNPEPICKYKELTVDCSHKTLMTIPHGLPRNTKRLVLCHNSIARLTAISFKGLPKLEFLDLSYNSLSHIDDAAFASMPRLKELLLGHNEIGKSLPPATFRMLTELTRLDLSHNLIDSSKTQLLFGLNKLSYLNLAQNKLKSVNLGQHLNLTDLKMLNLSRNIIDGLRRDDFAGLNGSSLNTLDISCNNITVIEDDVFQGCTIKSFNISESFAKNSSVLVKSLVGNLKGKHLQELKLQNLNLTRLNNGTFEGWDTETLSVLDLSLNKITVIENQDTFHGLGKLKYLNLDANGLTGFNNKIFLELKSLEQLSLNQNNITILKKNMFSEGIPLPITYLYLRNSNINKIETGAFSGFDRLENLKMYNNSIDGTLNNSCFQGLVNIKLLDLGKNKHIHLSPGTFSIMPTLKYLYLNLNLLTIDPSKLSPFTNLTLLKTLDLSNNNMDTVPFFDDLKSLETLYLQHNNLVLLWKKTHSGGPVFMLRNLTKLQNLHLGWNGLDNIPPMAFQDLHSLKYVSLIYNKLNRLPDELFNNTRKLQNLYLHNNMFTLVNQSNLAYVLPSLKVLSMNFNPFSCSCDLEWFRLWIGKTDIDIVDVEKYECFSPPSMSKQPVLSYMPSRWTCDGIPPTWFWGIIIAIAVVVMILIATGIRYRWHIKFRFLLIKARFRNYTPLEGQDAEYRYDAFVSHSSKDEEWIIQKLLPELEENGSPKFKMCYHERDFTGGKAIVDNIIECIAESRKTICVISEHFLESEWCKYEQTMALHRLFDDHKDVLILVLLKKVPDKKLTKYEKMHKLMKRKTYLEWPGNSPEKQQVFWQKLRNALMCGVKPSKNIDL